MAGWEGFAAQGASDISNMLFSIWKSGKDRKFQRQMFWLNAQREDTEMQRRVMDLKKAGLSPTLAAGGGGSSNVRIENLRAPEIRVNPLEALMAQNQMNKTKQEIDNMLAQQMVMASQIRQQESQRLLNESNANTNNWNLLLAQRRGTTTTQQSYVRDFVDAMGNLINRLRGTSTPLQGSGTQNVPSIWNDSNPLNFLTPFAPNNNPLLDQLLRKQQSPNPQPPAQTNQGFRESGFTSYKSKSQGGLGK